MADDGTALDPDTAAPPAADPPAGDPPAADPPAAAAAPPAADPPKADPPAAIEYDLKFPEGLSVDEATAAELKAYAKERGLSAADAQKFADLSVKPLQQAQAKYAEQIESLHAQWKTDAQNDKDFGGEKFQENLATAQKVIQNYGTAELIDVLNKTGLGNHPEVIRVFHKVGQILSEDSVASAMAATASAEKTPAQLIYGPQGSH